MPRRKTPINWPRQIEIGERVRVVRARHRYPQSEFAALLGVTRAQLACIESGKTALRYSLALRIQDLFKTDLSWLASGVKPMPVQAPAEDSKEVSPEQNIAPHTLLSEVSTEALPLARADIPATWNQIDKSIAYRSFIEVDLAEQLRERIASLPEDQLGKFWTDGGAWIRGAWKQFPALPPDTRVLISCQMDTLKAKEQAYLAENPGVDDFKFLPDSVEKSAENSLTEQRTSVKCDDVQAIMPTLIERLSSATEARGRKTALAEWLGVPPQRVNDWLSSRQHPNGETTLRLLAWVTAEEAKQTKSPAGARTPTEPKAQVRKSYEKKTNPDPP